jgi:3-hydroxyacyl-[acyl-carrier-protein] dehydratase
MSTDTIETNAVLDSRQIAKILPHRYPFLLVDRILSLDLEKGIIVGQKNLTMNEPFFQGHFPGAPIMPGVLILEALAQTGGVLLHLRNNIEDKIAVLLNVNNAKFRHPAKPGDVLYLRAEGLHFSSRGGKVKVQASLAATDKSGSHKIVAEAEIAFALVEKELI